MFKGFTCCAHSDSGELSQWYVQLLNWDLRQHRETVCFQLQQQVSLFFLLSVFIRPMTTSEGPTRALSCIRGKTEKANSLKWRGRCVCSHIPDPQAWCLHAFSVCASGSCLSVAPSFSHICVAVSHASQPSSSSSSSPRLLQHEGSRSCCDHVRRHKERDETTALQLAWRWWTVAVQCVCPSNAVTWNLVICIFWWSPAFSVVPPSGQTDHFGAWEGILKTKDIHRGSI